MCELVQHESLGFGDWSFYRTFPRPMGQTGYLQYNSKVDHNDARDRLESIETIQDNVLIVTVFTPSDQGTYSTSSNRKNNAIWCTCFCRSFWWTMHVTWKHGPATGH
jgi:hypothetical protein